MATSTEDEFRNFFENRDFLKQKKTKIRIFCVKWAISMKIYTFSVSVLQRIVRNVRNPRATSWKSYSLVVRGANWILCINVCAVGNGSSLVCFIWTPRARYMGHSIQNAVNTTFISTIRRH